MSKNNEERNLSYKNQSLNLRYFKYTFNTKEHFEYANLNGFASVFKMILLSLITLAD